MKTFHITTTTITHAKGDHVYDIWKRNMLELSLNSDLLEAPPEKIEECFHALYGTAVRIAENPMLAGTYVRRMVEYEPRSVGGVLLEALTHTQDLDPLVLEMKADIVEVFEGSLVGYKVGEVNNKRTVIWAYAPGTWQRFEESK